jgi:hypothetical protein
MPAAKQVRQPVLRVASDGQDVHVIFLDVCVTTDKREALDLSLSYQHPVERVAVMHRQPTRRDSVLGGDAQVSEAAVADPLGEIVWAKLAECLLDRYFPR